MPFPDEMHGQVEVSAYRPSWAGEGRALCAYLADLAPEAVAVEHIGSTAVPGMAAKDCLDVMIVVQPTYMAAVGEALQRAGYRRRSEEWNRSEPAADGSRAKLVF